MKGQATARPGRRGALAIVFTLALLLGCLAGARAQSQSQMQATAALIAQLPDAGILTSRGLDRSSFSVDATFQGLPCSLDSNETQCDEGWQCTTCVTRTCPDGQGECNPCMLGDFCPKGTRNEAYWTLLTACPAGHYCPTASTLLPCEPGWFCPEGTFHYWVPGLQGQSEGSGERCANYSGVHCPANSTKGTNKCKAGEYCPSAAKSYICPDGHYCKLQSMQPRKCSPGQACPAGSTAATPDPVLFAIILAASVLCVSAPQMLELYIRRRQVVTQRATNKQIAVAKNTKTVLSSMLGMDATLLAEEVPGFDACKTPITISFKNLGLLLKGQFILSNVNGEFKASRLIAVMGPSGCGKSTLLNTMCGKATYGRRVGVININGKNHDISEYKRVMGFVPQDDTVFEELTVRENLLWSAGLRLPKWKVDNPEMANAIIQGTIQVLNLDQIQNSIVGSVEKRGISGGQKKRVNMGLEVVSDPTVLLLDEPTSGLSSGDTLIVMKACRSMAFMQRTLVAVIHQPRFSVFELFHDVMLLGVGGMVVYFGETAHALEYFRMIGYEPPPNENVADFFLDCIGGSLRNKADPKFKPEHLFACWIQYEKDKAQDLIELKADMKLDGGDTAWQSAHRDTPLDEIIENVMLPEELTYRIMEQWNLVDDDKSGEIDVVEMGHLLEEFGVKMSSSDLKDVMNVFDKDHTGKIELREIMELARKQYAMSLAEGISASEPERHVNSPNHYGVRRVATVLQQVSLFFQRSMLQSHRQFRSNMFDALLLIGAAALVGLILGPKWTFAEVPTNASLSCVTLGVLSTVGSLKTFGSEAIMFQRERFAGMSTTAYFLAKNVMGLIENAARALLFTAVYTNFILPETPFLQYACVSMMVTWTSGGLGILMSVVMSPNNALLAGCTFPLVVGVFLSGVNPTLAEMSDFMAGAAHISFTRWAAEAVTIQEMKAQPNHLESEKQILYDTQGYTRANLRNDYLALFFLGLIPRLVAYSKMADLYTKLKVATTFTIDYLLEKLGVGEDDSAVEGDASSSDSELDNDLTVPIPRVVSTKTPRHAPSEDDHSPRSHRSSLTGSELGRGHGTHRSARVHPSDNTSAARKTHAMGLDADLEALLNGKPPLPVAKAAGGAAKPFEEETTNGSGDHGSAADKPQLSRKATLKKQIHDQKVENRRLFKQAEKKASQQQLMHMRYGNRIVPVGDNGEVAYSETASEGGETASHVDRRSLPGGDRPSLAGDAAPSVNGSQKSSDGLHHHPARGSHAGSVNGQDGVSVRGRRGSTGHVVRRCSYVRPPTQMELRRQKLLQEEERKLDEMVAEAAASYSDLKAAHHDHDHDQGALKLTDDVLDKHRSSMSAGNKKPPEIHKPESAAPDPAVPQSLSPTLPAKVVNGKPWDNDEPDQAGGEAAVARSGTGVSGATHSSGGQVANGGSGDGMSTSVSLDFQGSRVLTSTHAPEKSTVSGTLPNPELGGIKPADTSAMEESAAEDEANLMSPMSAGPAMTGKNIIGDMGFDSPTQQSSLQAPDAQTVDELLAGIEQ